MGERCPVAIWCFHGDKNRTIWVCEHLVNIPLLRDPISSWDKVLKDDWSHTYFI